METQGIDRPRRHRYPEEVFLPYTGGKAAELTAKIKQYTDLVERLRKEQTPELKEQARLCHTELMDLRKQVMIEMFGSVEQDDHAD